MTHDDRHSSLYVLPAMAITSTDERTFFYSLSDYHINDSHDPDFPYFQLVTNCIMLPIIAVLGVVGNIMTLVVLRHIRMEVSTLYLLRTLAITDTGILVCCIYERTPLSWANYHPGTLLYFKYHVFPIVLPYYLFGMRTVRIMNVWTVVTISTERFIAICYPFKASTLLTPKKTKAYLAAIFVYAFIHNIPKFFIVDYHKCPHFSQTNIDISDIHRGLNVDFQLFTSTSTNRSVPSNSTVTILKVSFVCLLPYYQKSSLQEFYDLYLHGIILFVAPIVILFTFNGLLIRQLTFMRRKRRVTVSDNTLPFENDYERDISHMLILVMIVFLVCQSFAFLSRFKGLTGVHQEYFLHMAHVLIVINSSVNFLIYTKCGLKFRRTFFRAVRRSYYSIARISRPNVSTNATHTPTPTPTPTPPPIPALTLITTNPFSTPLASPRSTNFSISSRSTIPMSGTHPTIFFDHSNSTRTPHVTSSDMVN